MTPPTVAVLNGELQNHDRGYEVNGIHSPSAVAARLLDDDTTVVVVDVVRCTTTLTGVLAAGAAFVQMLAKTDDDDVVPAIAQRHVGRHGSLPYVLAGEKHGKPIPGGAFSNSVLEVPADLQGTGVCRAAVVALADRHNLLVIEDDPYRDIAFDGPVPTTLHAAAHHRVVHIRSLSKVLAPGLRLAATVGRRDLIDVVTERKPVGGTNPHTSEAIAEMLGTFDFPAHVARLRAAYRHRRDVLVGALASLVPVLEASPPAGGFFTWMPLPGHLDPEALHRGASPPTSTTSRTPSSRCSPGTGPTYASASASSRRSGWWTASLDSPK